MATAQTVRTIPWWKEPTKDQWLAWWAAWLGWTAKFGSVAMSCPNWPFRMNKNPWRAPMQLTDEDRERRRERGLALAAGRAQKTVSDK